EERGQGGPRAARRTYLLAAGRQPPGLSLPGQLILTSSKRFYVRGIKRGMRTRKLRCNVAVARLTRATEGGSMSDVVQRTLDGGVAILTLNRPDRLNAWTAEMEQAYFDLLEECGRAEEVRAIVVTGAGRGFCAGADMEELQASGQDGIQD